MTVYVPNLSEFLISLINKDLNDKKLQILLKEEVSTTILFLNDFHIREYDEVKFIYFITKVI